MKKIGDCIKLYLAFGSKAISIEVLVSGTWNLVWKGFQLTDFTKITLNISVVYYQIHMWPIYFPTTL